MSTLQITLGEIRDLLQAVSAQEGGDDRREPLLAALERALRRLSASSSTPLVAELSDDDARQVLRVVYDGIPGTAFVLLDREGRVLTWNAEAERLHRVSGERVVGQHFSVFYSDEDIVLGRPVLHLAEARALGRVQSEGYRARGDGSRFWAVTALTRLRSSATSQGATYLLVVTDATDRHRSELDRADLLARAERARLEAEAASRAKDEFLANLSHELRTPLTSIVGWARILRTQQLDEAGVARGLQVVERNARLLNGLIDDLLDLSRITTGKLRLELLDVELPPILDAALETLRPTADARGVRLEKVVAETDVISGDADRLQQVVWNLVANAIKFTPAGGTVRVEVARAGDDLVLTVTDDGQGIDAAFLPFLFERMSQGDSSATRHHRGLGLGLSIVRHIVELHGGAVSAASDGPGKGSTFTVRLPVVRQGALERKRTTLPPVEVPRSLTGLRVLLVDDDDDTRELLTRVLETAGLTVSAAPGAREALAMLSLVEPDVLVSDLGMPGEDGFSLLASIRESHADLPALALTAHAHTRDRARVLAAGFQLHVPKPVDPSELVLAIASVIRRGR
jgi:PAS domain S-box-containing protein